MERLDGVEQVTVTFDPPEAVVQFGNEKIDAAALIDAVEKAGFQAKP
ncbi:MAG: heavy-metal-associated domain-containing protein, partial [Acidobacteriota bacterium]